MGLTIGVDLGGTKVAGGVTDEDGNILARARIDTPAHDAEAAADAIVSVIEELRADHAVVAVGLAVAGFVNAERTRVYLAPNLPDLHNTPLRDDVSRRVGLPVVVENDANAAAWGEYRFGAGRGEPDLVCVTVGTGVGGGVVVNGALARGRFGVAGEIGHVQVVEGGRLCGCGQRGCLEQYASGRALVREARERAAESPDEAQILLRVGDGSPEGITGRNVTKAAEQGDTVALAAFDVIATWLGQGLADLAAVLDSGRFILGGGVSEAGDLLLVPTRAAFAARLTGATRRPVADIEGAALGNDAGVAGAADLARLR